MEFRPLHARVVVRGLNAEEKSVGASSFPTLHKKSRWKAKSSPSVEEPATTRTSCHPRGKGGRSYPVGKWSGAEVRLAGDELLIMKGSDVLGIIEGSPVAGKKAA
jgi:chaperonin GroES